MTDAELTYTGETFCFKCKQKREMVEAAIELSTKNNRTTRMAKSICPVCGSKLTRFLPKVQPVA